MFLGLLLQSLNLVCLSFVYRYIPLLQNVLKVYLWSYPPVPEAMHGTVTEKNLSDYNHYEADNLSVLFTLVPFASWTVHGTQLLFQLIFVEWLHLNSWYNFQSSLPFDTNLLSHFLFPSVQTADLSLTPCSCWNCGCPSRSSLLFWISLFHIWAVKFFLFPETLCPLLLAPVYSVLPNDPLNWNFNPIYCFAMSFIFCKCMSELLSYIRNLPENRTVFYAFYIDAYIEYKYVFVEWLYHFIVT